MHRQQRSTLENVAIYEPFFRLRNSYCHLSKSRNLISNGVNHATAQWKMVKVRKPHEILCEARNIRAYDGSSVPKNHATLRKRG